jgi:hypothetical protein
MKKLIFLLTIIGFVSCGQSSNKLNTDNDSQVDRKTQNALAFINGYVENGNKMNQAIGIIDWVNSNKLATEGFKKELKRIVDEAYKIDPELGLDADPIFDAQDYPDKGFVIESFDDKSNYLIVKGIDWPDFKLTMKLKNENGIWLVDGCGIVNIPIEKRAKR